MSTADAYEFRGVRLRKGTLLWGLLVLNTEILLLFAYALLGSGTLTGPLAVRYWLYPFVWLNVGAWAVVRTQVPKASTRQRLGAGALAVGYFLVLAYAGGLVALANGPALGTSVTLSLPPGWSPALLHNGSVLTLTLLPFKVGGYLALAYLVYATVLDAAGSAVSGLLGLLSCVSCTWPVLASVVAGLLGSSSALAGAVYAQSYGLSTVVFVVTVALLYWRPTPWQ